ncbi:hypothetical protein O0L34_g11522 [Tuta absoluta]|nr:hypothetical protein O0L34_g11522 [Tuta absoluta]
MDNSNSAFLRIKFAPLVKKISSENIASKCCIEIVPELANTLNLNKISWKDENDLFEYNIPMTYKIIIKKPSQLSNVLEKKVYHSCVDLLADYSMSNADIGAGDDIKKIKSDNSFILNSYTCDEKCEVIPTKALLANKYCKNKSTNMQSPNNSINLNPNACGEVCEVMPSKTLLADKHCKDKSNEMQPSKARKASINITMGIDEDFQTNLNSNIPLHKTKLRVSKSEETLKSDIKDNATTTCDLTNQSLTDLSKKNSTGSLNAYIEGFHEKCGQRKLSLSPICSVNTWDKCTSSPIYLTNNRTTTFVYSKNDTADKATIYDFDDNSAPKMASSKENFPSNIETNKILRVYETKTNFTIQLIDNTKRSQKTNDAKTGMRGHPKSTFTTVKDITTSVSEIKITSYEIDNNYPQKHSHDESQNYFKFKNVNESIIFPNKTKPTSILKSVDELFAEEKSEDKNINNTTTICPIDPNQRRSPVRAPPAVRVARIMKFFEEEIFPLNAMLNEIKYKCVGLGLSDLFSGDIRPSSPSSPKSIIYKTIPDYQFITDDDDDESNKQKTNTVKSNRVVYSFLFNG